MHHSDKKLFLSFFQQIKIRKWFSFIVLFTEYSQYQYFQLHSRAYTTKTSLTIKVTGAQTRFEPLHPFIGQLFNSRKMWNTLCYTLFKTSLSVYKKSQNDTAGTQCLHTVYTLALHFFSPPFCLWKFLRGLSTWNITSIFFYGQRQTHKGRLENVLLKMLIVGWGQFTFIMIIKW